MICTAASNGVCTACKVDNSLFKNPVTPQKPGSECILCSDATDRNGVMGVKDCLKCQAPQSAGAAICDTCKAGTYKSGSECKPCTPPCTTCETTATQCTSCETGKYLKSNQCVQDTGCDGNTYPDPESGKCLPCNTIDQACTTCKYNATVSKPQCTACSGGKIVKVGPDGGTTCVTTGECAGNDQAGSYFLTKNSAKCLLCYDKSDTTEPVNTGIDGCGTCKKTTPDQNVVCTACMDGYYNSASSGAPQCKPCVDNCGACTAGDMGTCTKCKPGFFLKNDGAKKCVPCDDPADGVPGCATCTLSGSFTCETCKVNYQKKVGAGGAVTCTKTCEDDTACGGTSGACDAIVIDANGKELHYCSYCGETNEFPINGVCVDTGKKEGNTCDQGVCTKCTNNYFLYMNGCYKVDQVPGSHMCSEATTAGVCTAANANDKYFIVPGASNTEQSILACGNPLGTLIGTKAYVGVDGCSQCTAPVALSGGGMTPAVCTSCDNSKKPNKDGSGCFTCAIEGCSHCDMDNKCEACSSGKVSPGRKSCVDGCPSNSTDTDSVCVCSDGYSPDDAGTSCVSSGANRSGLSTGAIAGISVAAIAVVGGLVGFLCWWFLCRGKA